MGTRPPGTTALTSAIASYVAGFAAAGVMVGLLDRHRDAWISLGFLASFACFALDLVAVIGGIAGLVAAGRAAPPLDRTRPIVALVMGLSGMVGVLGLLLLTGLAGLTAH